MHPAAFRNCRQLVEAAVAALQAAGWSEDRIVPALPHLAREAAAFLAARAAH